MDAPALFSWLAECRQSLDRFMEPLFADSWPASFVEPVRYPLFGGGKRVRPALTIAAYQAVADDPSDEAALPYVNIFAARADDADNEVLLQLVEIFQSNQEVLDGLQEVAGGTAVFATTPAADLQASLVEVEESLQAQG